MPLISECEVMEVLEYIERQVQVVSSCMPVIYVSCIKM